MDPIIAKLVEYSALAGVLALIVLALWKDRKRIERERAKDAKAMNERLTSETARCEKELGGAVNRIRCLEDARVQDMREDKQALVRVLDRTAAALETNAVAFKTLVDERREGSGQHPTRRT